MSKHTETKTYTSSDGTTTTTTTTITSHYSSSDNFDNFDDGEDILKKYSNILPSHGQIKKVSYNKQERTSDLPDEFNVHIKPTEKVDYQPSDCTGLKRAVLIGINYINTEVQLRGCINDVANIKKFITENYGFKESNMKVLTDDQLDPELRPTRENIIKAIKWLVHDPQAHDSYFFHYSGHGSQLPDNTGDEEDGLDETICPLDYETNGQIVDDELNDLMVDPLPAGARLTVVFDCCHSGTVLDLPYVYSTHGVLKGPNVFKSLLNKGLKGTEKEQQIRRMNIETKGSSADVIMFSGCKDVQTSADAQEAGSATGAMSYALIKSLEKNMNPTYQQLLNSIRDILKNKYDQKPQLSASHEMNMSDEFIM